MFKIVLILMTQWILQIYSDCNIAGIATIWQYQQQGDVIALYDDSGTPLAYQEFDNCDLQIELLDPVGDTYSLKVTVDYVNTFNRVYVKNLLNECAGLSECTLKIGIVPLVAGALADNYFIMTFSAEIQQYTNNNEQGIVVSSNIGIIGSIDLQQQILLGDYVAYIDMWITYDIVQSQLTDEFEIVKMYINGIMQIVDTDYIFDVIEMTIKIKFTEEGTNTIQIIYYQYDQPIRMLMMSSEIVNSIKGGYRRSLDYSGQTSSKQIQVYKQDGNNQIKKSNSSKGGNLIVIVVVAVGAFIILLILAYCICKKHHHYKEPIMVQQPYIIEQPNEIYRQYSQPKLSRRVSYRSQPREQRVEDDNDYYIN